MKNLGFRTIVYATVLLSVFACSEAKSPTEEDATTVGATSGEVQKVDYTVEGMVCAMGCAATIEAEVAEMEGVIVSEVNYEQEKAHFEFDPSKTSEEAIKTKISSIADGQYTLKEWEESQETETIEETEATENVVEEEVVNVSLPQIEIPNLLTLLLNQV